MATTPKRNRTSRANLWDFLLVLSRNPTILRLLAFLMISAVVCFLLVVGLQGRAISIAGWSIGAQPVEPTGAAAPTALPTDTPVPAVASTAAAPSPTLAPAVTIAPTSVAVNDPAPTQAAWMNCPRSTTPLPLNAALIVCAWSYWDDGLYEEVIAVTDECIDTFDGQALRDQQALSREGRPAPITGQPADADVKAGIFEQGVLNDVAACHFVRGQALERLGRLDEAKDAYGNVLRYPHARVWDPAGDPTGLGFFWSPSVAASDRLAVLP